MTESDLRDARDALGERLDSQRPPRSRAAIIAVAAAAVVIPVLGFIAFQTIGEDDKTAPPPADPAPTSVDPYADFLTGDAPTPELVEGVWRVDGGSVVMRFAAPGFVSMDDAGRLFHSPHVQGAYVIEGDLITVAVEGDRRDATVRRSPCVPPSQALGKCAS